MSPVHRYEYSIVRVPRYGEYYIVPGRSTPQNTTKLVGPESRELSGTSLARALHVPVKDIGQLPLG